MDDKSDVPSPCCNNRRLRKDCVLTIGRDDAKKFVPDGKWGWWVVFASFMIHFINDGVALSMGELFEQLMKKYDVGSGTTSSILSVIIGTSLCTGPISSALINVYGCRTVTIIGSLIASAFIALSSYVTNITVLAFTLGFATGFGFGISYLPALICITYYFDKYCSLATGIAVCGSGFGTIVFSSFYKLALSKFEIERVLLMTSLLVLTCMLFSLFFQPLPRDDPVITNKNVTQQITLLSTTKISQKVIGINDDEEKSQKNFSNDKSQLKSSSSSADNNLESMVDSLRCVGTKKKSRLREEFENALNELTDCTFMKDPIFVLFAASNFLTSIGFDGPFIFVPILCKEKGIDQQLSGSLLSIIGAGNVVGRIFLTYICDYFGLNRLYFYSSCLFVSGIVTIFSVYCENVISFSIFCLIYGVLISAYISFSSALTVDLFGSDKVTNILGIILLFQGIAAFFGPPIAGAICDYFQNYDPAFLFCGILLAASGLILYPIPLCRRYLHKYKTGRDLDKTKYETEVANDNEIA